MKKCILVPDSFKGTMSSIEVSHIMKTHILKRFPSCQVIAVPVADGGEGTVDCFLTALGGERVECTVSGPFMEPVHAFYGVAGKTAIIEMAAAAGLPLAAGRLNPLAATTYGVGQLIRNAVEKGCDKIILGLGGSCTNDAGAGMAAALGTAFLNGDGVPFIPTGGNLSAVKEIDIMPTRQFLKGITITAMCDINNPMHGPEGAAYVFGPQKGATSETVEILDIQLQAFASTVKKFTGVDVSRMKGAGAAGAMGAGVQALLGGQLKQGIDTVLDIVEFEELLTGCDCVFTGEGKLDHQSLSGKVVVGVGLRAKEKHIPVVAVVGTMEKNLDQVYSKGVTRVYETGTGRSCLAEMEKHCVEDLNTTMARIMESIKLSQSF